MTDRAQNLSYSMILEWDPRSDIFVVTIPEFALCHTHGRDYEEAARSGYEAIEVCVDLDRALALPLPEPNIFDDDRSDCWWDLEGGTKDLTVDTLVGGYPPYSMVLEWDPRDNIIIATIPEFRGARTHGDTYDQAARMGREVIEMFVDHAQEDGKTLPSVRIFPPRRVKAVA